MMKLRNRIISVASAAGLALWLGMALTFTAAAQPAAQDPATPTPTTVPPTAQPPIVIVVPVGGGSGGGGGAPVDNTMPMLNIESYTVNPNPVKSNQTFDLSITVKNVGAKYANKMTVAVEGSGQFVGLAPAPMVEKLDPTFAVNFTLSVRAATLASGAYEIPLVFSYRVGESGEFTTVRKVGILVTGGTGVTGRPLIVVERMEAPALPAAGTPFNATLIFKNTGPRQAFGLSATLKLNEYLSPAAGSGTTQLGDLRPGQTVTLTLGLVLNKANASGRVAQTFTLDYKDGDNRAYTSEETASLDLGAAGRQNPQLIVASHATLPDRLFPGQLFTLTLNVANVGAGEAQRVLLRLGDESGGLDPFAPVSASNVRFLDTLPAGGVTVITQTLIADGAAKGGAYRIKVGLTYENALGETKTESEIISLLISVPPQLRVSLFEPPPAPLLISETFEIPVEVVNIGRQALNVSTVEITSPDLELSEASLYLGPLDAGTSGSLTAKATPRRAGPATALVTVHYLDDFNQSQAVTQTLTFNIEAPETQPVTSEKPKESSSLDKFWQGLLGFFGLGG